MATSQSTDAPPLGARAWELMYDIFRASKPYMESVAADYDLTPQQMFSLKCLTSERPLTMSEMATLLGCDASNVTSIVDRLESRGLVERRSFDRDRRVKALVMTPAGLALKERIAERMHQPPPAIDNLSAQDKADLCAIFERALASLEKS